MGKVLSQGLYFIVIAKTLGAEQFGTFSGAFAFVNIFSPISMFGSGNLLVMNVARDNSSFDRFFGNCTIFLLMSSSVLLSIVILLSKFFLPQTPLLVVIFIGVAELLFYRFVDIAAQSFQALERMKVSANIYLVSSLVRLTMSFIFLLILNHNVVAWSAVYLASNIIVGTSAYVYLISNIKAPKFDKSLISYTLRNGLPFSFGVSATSLYNDIDKVYMSRFDQSNIAGAYNAAYRIILLLITPLQSVVYSLNTKMFKIGEAGLQKLIPILKRVVVLTFAYCVFAFIGFYLLNPLIPKFLGASYQLSSTIALFMLPLLPLNSINYLIGDLLMGAGYQRQRSQIQIGVAFIASLLGFFVIQKFSWQGAIIIAVGAQMILFLSLSGLFFAKSRENPNV